MHGIFISYRREDAAGYAGRLYDRLAAHFGDERVFMDVEEIEPGADFVDAIARAVGSCEVLIVIIGNEWLAVDSAGHRRLDDPTDFVRIETATALVRGIRVVPVLVDGAVVPRADQLPVQLVPLTRRQAVELSHKQWDATTGELIRTLEKILTKDKARVAKTSPAEPMPEVEPKQSGPQPDRRKALRPATLGNRDRGGARRRERTSLSDAAVARRYQATSGARGSARHARPGRVRRAALASCGTGLGSHPRQWRWCPAATAQRQDRGTRTLANSHSTTVNAAHASSDPAKRALSKLPSFRGSRACVPPRSRSRRRGRRRRQPSACRAEAQSRWRPSPPLRPRSRTGPRRAAGPSTQRKPDAATAPPKILTPPPAQLITVPDQIGKSRRDAIAELEKAGLEVRVIEDKPESTGSGAIESVVSQLPKGGEQLKAGGRVTLNVAAVPASTAPAPAPAAPVPGQPPGSPPPSLAWATPGMYRVRSMWKNVEERTYVHQVTAVSGREVRETMADVASGDNASESKSFGSDPRFVEWRGKGFYVVEFNPFLQVFGELQPDTAWKSLTIPYEDPSNWYSQGRVRGWETVSVPAGTFKALRVELNSAARPGPARFRRRSASNTSSGTPPTPSAPSSRCARSTRQRVPGSTRRPMS